MLIAHRQLIQCVFLGFVCGCWQVVDAETTVVSGTPLATIVVGRQASSPSRFAAEELQGTIRRMSGVACPIVMDDEAPTEPFIAVGPPDENRATARLLKKADVDFDGLQLGPDGFTLQSVGANLVVAGNTGRATLFGAYALLERWGCRWCFPGPHGDVIPKQSSLTLSELAVVERPAFSYRTFMHHEVVSEKTADWIDWMAKNRMNRFLVTLYPAKGYKGQLYAEFKNTPGLLAAIQKRGLHIEAGHHASYYWIPPREFFATHPEFFALIKGKRGPASFESDAGQLCFSNPQVAEITASRIIRFARENPEVDILSLYTNDDYGYCECDACRALGSKTDAYIVYVNRVAERVYKTIPNLKLAFLSYSDVSKPPEQVKVFGKNTVCVIATWPLPDKSRLKGWLASGAGEVVLYEYYMGSYSHRSLPGVWPKLIADELKQIHKQGLAGVASQCELDNWGAYGLNYWVAARKLWDPTLALKDVEADYFDHYYAEAGSPMHAYFDYLESFGVRKPDLDGLSKDNQEKLSNLLAAGEQVARSEPVRARIQRDRIALDYLQKAWTIEDAQRKAKSLFAMGREQEAIGELQRGEQACNECLDYMARHGDARVFLVGASNRPSQLVAYHYNTQYYKTLSASFAKPAKWIAKERKRLEKERMERDKENKASRMKAVPE